MHSEVNINSKLTKKAVKKKLKIFAATLAYSHERYCRAQPGEKSMQKILVFEKNDFFRDSLLRIIELRFPSDVVVKSVLRREECLDEVSVFMPDILLLGLNAFNGNELNLLEFIHQKSPSISIILLSNYDIDEYRKNAILKGASYIIPRELWTGNEILALLRTILTSKEKPIHNLAEDSSNAVNFLEGPIERRRKDPQGRDIERKFLTRHLDRRRENTKSGLSS
jgi:DNA-binding NarL/FixJ family response regulator